MQKRQKLTLLIQIIFLNLTELKDKDYEDQEMCVNSFSNLIRNEFSTKSDAFKPLRIYKSITPLLKSIKESIYGCYSWPKTKKYLMRENNLKWPKME